MEDGAPKSRALAQVSGSSWYWKKGSISCPISPGDSDRVFFLRHSGGRVRQRWVTPPTTLRTTFVVFMYDRHRIDMVKTIFLPGKHPLFRSLTGWWGSPSQPRWKKQYLTCLSKISMSVYIAVVPHNAVETYRRAWLLWITDGRANPLMDRKVVGVLFLGVVAMVVAVTYHNCWM